MTQATRRLRSVAREDIQDPKLLEIVARAERLSAPKPEWYLATAHNPKACAAFDDYWDAVYRNGLVEHVTKELMRLAIVQLLGCDFCSSQRSVAAQAEGLDEDEVQACAMPDFNPPDPRVRAAVRYARALALDHAGADTSIYDEIYEDLHAHFSEEEIVELAYLAMITIGGTKVARSLDLL
jgi:alkylhydroperoxidase family enzyme